MGKAQSKRSIDITTEVKQSNQDEVTEKLEKIEDVESHIVENGHNPDDCNKLETKLQVDQSENNKDLQKEKSLECEYNNDNIEDIAPDSNHAQENVKTIEEIGPLSDENCKKLKKDKVKKKWSFRSISFGKKDKQKPFNKTDDTKSNIELNGTEKCIENLIGSEDGGLPDNPKSIVSLENCVIDDDLQSKSEQNSVHSMESSAVAKTDIISESKNMENVQETDELITSIAMVARLDLESENILNGECDIKEQSNDNMKTINKAGEGNIKTNENISNSTEENVSIDIKTDMDLNKVFGESFEDSKHGTHPPPLPSSPPPNTVSTFDFNDQKSEDLKTDNPSVSAESSVVNTDNSVDNLDTNTKEEISGPAEHCFKDDSSLNDDNVMNTCLKETNVSDPNCTIDMIAECKQDLSITLEGNDTITEKIETSNCEDGYDDKSLNESESRVLNKAHTIPLTEDIKNHSLNTKDITMEDNVPDETTQELPLACE